ncbi:MAG: hypothetical protein LBH82_02400 [Bacteroidales bacterium]|jgi:asparagine synthase (glutamine-hydrolysing)|nr:hypothetical protein [Bacteroidales bacterium]
MSGLFALIEKDVTFSSQCEHLRNAVFVSDGKTFSLSDYPVSGRVAMRTTDGQLACVENYRIVFEGDLFNRKDILREIHTFMPNYSSSSDAEMVLWLFIRKGTTSFADLDGYWSLIISDADNRKIYAAGDAFGNNSLFYCQTNSCFFIASQWKTLFSATDEAKEINQNAVVEYLLWGNTTNTQQGFFTNIHTVKPSHYIEYSLENNSFRELPYYQLPYKDCKGGYNEYEEPYYFDTVRQLVLESVAHNIAGKKAVAMQWNGEVSHAVFLYCAKKINPDLRIEAYSVSDFCETDPLFLTEKNTENTNTVWKNVSCSPQDMMKQLNAINKTAHFPVSDSMSIVRYKIMEKANEQGVDSMISTQGSDELFAGRQQYFSPFLRSLSSQLMLKHWLKEVMNCKNSNIRFKDIFSRQQKQAFQTKPKELEWLNKDYSDAYFAKKHFSTSSKEVLNDCLYESYTSVLPQMLAVEKQIAARFGMNCLTPFSNSKKLAEYVFSIPSTFKIHNGWNNYLLRNALIGIVPDEILWRKQKPTARIFAKKYLSEMGEEIKKHLSQQDDIEQLADKNTLLKQWDNVYTSEHFQLRAFVFRYLSYLFWRNGLYNTM